MLVTIDALDEYGLPVHEELTVFDFNFSKSKLAALDFQNVAVSVLQRQQNRIQTRCLRRPFQRICHSRFHLDDAFAFRRDIRRTTLHHYIGADSPILFIQQCYFHLGIPASCVTVIPHAGGDMKNGIPVCIVQIAPYFKISYMQIGRGEQIDIAIDA